MRALIAVFLTILTAQAAQAQTLYVDCQRYESKCAGDKCFAIADTLKLDTKKEILAARPMEDVSYKIDEHHAVGKFTEFEYVTQDDSKVVLENKTDSGAVRERVIIDKLSGFYEKYMLHTDGSMKDVPVGKPYNAYFGWCVDKTAEHTPPAAPATPAAPQR